MRGASTLHVARLRLGKSDAGVGRGSRTRESDGGGLRLLAYASESEPIFTPEFPKADPYPRNEGRLVMRALGS